MTTDDYARHFALGEQQAHEDRRHLNRCPPKPANLTEAEQAWWDGYQPRHPGWWTRRRVSILEAA